MNAMGHVRQPSVVTLQCAQCYSWLHHVVYCESPLAYMYLMNGLSLSWIMIWEMFDVIVEMNTC